MNTAKEAHTGLLSRLETTAHRFPQQNRISTPVHLSRCFRGSEFLVVSLSGGKWLNNAEMGKLAQELKEKKIAMFPASNVLFDKS